MHTIKKMFNVQCPIFNKRRGFTLIELMIVMGIIAVLGGAVALISVPGNLQKGRDGRRQTDLEAIRSALEIYRSDKGTYPPTGSLVGPLVSDYMSAVPTDPKTPATQYPYTGFPANCTGILIKCTTYKLCATLEKDGSLYCVINP